MNNTFFTKKKQINMVVPLGVEKLEEKVVETLDIWVHLVLEKKRVVAKTEKVHMARVQQRWLQITK